MRYFSFLKPLQRLIIIALTAVPAITSAQDNAPSPSIGKASRVEIIKDDSGYKLSVNGSPFVVKGVGIGGRNPDRVYALAEAGGNSFRTWHTRYIDQQLELASNLGLMVAVGIYTGKQLQGFDYDDETAVAKQFERVTGIIQKYKDHPNVLAWVISNEPNLIFDDQGKLSMVNPKVYEALADITDYIHKVDPNHPVTFALAGMEESHIRAALEHAPNIDFISLQIYGKLGNLGRTILDLGIDKPYMVTEFGPTGHWEVPKTSWGREIEEASALKAAAMVERMESAILNDQTGQVIGSYAFLWGQKQERTPTWYGMFNASGEATTRVDELSRIWNGQYPDNRAPLSYPMQLNNKVAEDSAVFKPGQEITASFKVEDPDGDSLNVNWELMGEVGQRSAGGHYEKTPSTFALDQIDASLKEGTATLTFKAPKTPGEYRLFAYSYDNHDHVANVNFPFLVAVQSENQ
jgi:hypothetical protein